MSLCSLKIFSSSYHKEDVKNPIFNGVNAIFSTEKNNLGGYSYFHSSDILTGMGHQPLPIMLSELSKSQLNDQLMQHPFFVLTPVVSNNANEAYQLLVEILKLSDKLGLNKIVFSHFIELKSKQERKYHQNFAGIVEAIKRYTPKHNIELIFLVDKRYADYYVAEFNLSGN